MPSPELVQEFIHKVQAGHFIDAMSAFYADDASMQENGAEPRRGLPSLIAHEQAVLAAHSAVRVLPVDACCVDGDQVFIHWVFEFTRHDGRLVRLDELAWQRWRGDRIAHERFYYDPMQLRADSDMNPSVIASTRTS